MRDDKFLEPANRAVGVDCLQIPGFFVFQIAGTTQKKSGEYDV